MIKVVRLQKNLFQLLLVASMIVFFLSGCGSSPSPTEEADDEETTEAVIEVETIRGGAMQEEDEGRYTPYPTNTRSVTSTPELEIEVAVSSANVREGPGTNYDVVGIMMENETAVVIGRTNDSSWYNIQLADGSRAWIGSSVVNTINSGSIRAAATIPAPSVDVAPTSPPNPTSPPAQPTTTQLPAATSAPPPTQPPPPTEASAICSCSGDLYNCGDFGTHNAAQACFNYCVSIGAGDIHGLDRNNDGMACESLP
jgi:hypothetical protein